MSNFDAEYEKTPGYFGSEPSSLIIRYGRLIPEKAHVLDVGIGQGRNAITLARQSCRVTGIDASEVAIQMTAGAACDAEISLDLWNGSVFDYQAEKNAFDVILLFGLIQILEREQVSGLLTRVDHWLTPGGLVFVTAWHVGDPRYAAIRESWEQIEKNSFRKNDDEIRTYLEHEEILAMFDGWTVIHHWEGLGPVHRHGESPPERHGSVEFIGKKRLE